MVSSKNPFNDALPNGRYPNFDILRLALALLVVFDHALYYVNPTSGWNSPISAVPAFLGIGGFLVLKSYFDTGNLGTFLIKRGLRVLPALAMSLILCWVLFDNFAVYNSLLNYFTGGLYTLPGTANGPLWSLAWEELAYLGLAALWFLGAYKKQIFIWVLLIISLVIANMLVDLPVFMRMILNLPPAFLAGNLMYLNRKTLMKVNKYIPWILLLGLFVVNRIPLIASVYSLSPILFQAIIIVWVGMAGAPVIRQAIPDFSYGAYVYHFPLILLITQKGWANNLAEMLVFLGIQLSIIVFISWFLIEKPALDLKKKFIVKKRFENSNDS